MAVLNESNRLCDILVGESAINNRHSRDKITIASGETVVVGEVVAKITASGNYVPIDFAGVDGSENAAGVVIDNYDASAADVEGVIINRSAVFREDGLVWPDGATAPQIAGALAQLEDKGIKVRESA